MWPAYWVNQTDPDILDPVLNSLQYSYQYEFSFCQQMSGAANATCYDSNSYAIGSVFNATEYELTK